MSAFALRLQSTLIAFARGLTARIVHDERGQDTIEYLGVLIVVAAIVGVVATVASGLGGTISSGVTHLISNVFSAK